MKLTKIEAKRYKESTKPRKIMYRKIFGKKITCKECSFKWFYKTIRCPICEVKI